MKCKYVGVDLCTHKRRMGLWCPKVKDKNSKCSLYEEVEEKKDELEEAIENLMDARCSSTLRAELLKILQKYRDRKRDLENDHEM